MKRREARKVAVQALYQVEMTECGARQAIQNVLEENEVDHFLYTLVQGVVDHQLEIDAKIRQALTNWSLERLSRVDRAIIRLAVFELLHLDDVPQAVIVNEAVELGKMFGNEENGKFVNGVLSKMIQNIQSAE